MGNEMSKTLGRSIWAIALLLAALALTACGASSEPAAAPAEPAAPTEASAASQRDSTGAPVAAARMAPAFELPNAAGETVSLASYAGDKNVVLVFYRGFW